MSMSSTAAELWSSGYTLSLPLHVELESGKTAVCEEVVRAMPGRRYVCRGRYADQDVFIKLFSMNRRASNEWRDEQSGIAALHEVGIAAPEILYAGVVADIDTQVVVYAALPGAESARQRWEQGDEAMRLEVLVDLVELVAQHHAAGLRQSDLHMLNFLYSDSVLYTLDASEIHASEQPLSRVESMDGLADLLALLPVEYDELVGDLYNNYWQARGGEASEGEQASLQMTVSKKRRYKHRKYLSKVFRSCTAFVAVKTWHSFTVYDRSRESDALVSLLADPDNCPEMQDVRMLKDGNTCTVSEFELDGMRVVSKRYNIKHAWHALRRTLRMTRAARSWINSHRLLRCGIATARPIALREQRFGPMRGRAWLFIEKIEGESLYQYLKRPEKQDSDEFRVIAQAFVPLFEKMVLERISHGDMKAGNFIYYGDTLYMIDLDSMQAHDDDVSFARAFVRDMRRFFKNWQDYPATAAQFHEVLSQTRVAPYLPDVSNVE